MELGLSIDLLFLALLRTRRDSHFWVHLSPFCFICVLVPTDFGSYVNRVIVIMSYFEVLFL